MLKVGEKTSWQRTFTEAEVRLFTELSGDRGEHHTTRDAEGRLMAHGLLTATLPTKIGGDWNVVAREMKFEFVCPVFTGDVLECDVNVTEVEQMETVVKLAARFECRNQRFKEVMKGEFRSIIRKPAEK